MKAIIAGTPISEHLVLGGLSAIFWTLTLQTTLKYVVLTLRADNNGEGGIFSLYTLVKRRSRKLVFVAMVGGATLLADGMITPSISISSAVEGLRLINPDISTVPIVLFIICLLFFFQRFGSAVVGRSFGPIMLLWFVMLGGLGLLQLVHFPHVLLALNPMYAIDLLIAHPDGFWLLGAVFLCTTGAEALYSDLGHCGRENIRVSWTLVKVCLLLNYLGQGAYLLHHEGQVITSNPFYDIMPSWFLYAGIMIATLAAIIASQALISGSYTLISEAIRLELFPKVTVKYPGKIKGQLYVPSVNAALWIGCMLVVLIFRESSNMEAAYGLSITVTMLMTTVLLAYYLGMKRYNSWAIAFFLLVYALIEGAFLWANLIKFMHGGYVTVIMATFLFALMYVSYAAHRVRRKLTTYVPLDKYADQLALLSIDTSIPKYATNLVYLTNTARNSEIDYKVVYSILQKQPKRADVYWFVHIETTDEPYTMEYEVSVQASGKVVRVNFNLGFRVEQKIYLFLRTIAEEMVRNGELRVKAPYHAIEEYEAGDFMFVISEEILSYENDLPLGEQMVMNTYVNLKSRSASPHKWFGLDTSAVTFEKVPLVVRPVSGFKLERVQA